MSLLTGTVTFLFTDIEGSTRIVQELGDTLSNQVFADHRWLMVEAVESTGGSVYQDQGESFVFVFPRAKNAVLAAVVAQRALRDHAWLDRGSLRVRMGLHTGEPVGKASEYVGLDVHRAARICQAGHGGQILLSQTSYDLVVDDLPDGVWVRDLGEHRLKDLARPLHLHQVVATDLPADFPPLRSLDVLPNNLPIQLTSFIGREQEIAEVKRLLSRTRLLTLTGEGGVGKTRLALQVAAEALEEFSDGVWLAELARLSDPELVVQAVAVAVGVREQPGRLLLATLVEHVRLRRPLLLLDNCEHLIAACAHLAETLLQTCPLMRILATSREPLQIAGERVWRVPSLSSPDLHRLPPAERLTQYEAVRLFEDRARAALPEFALTDHNGPAVAEVCHRLDGIPLALELAAARVKLLPVEQIARRLNDRFRLLTGGSRTALPRHRTLLAALDWSYALLSDKERTLFRRLSVFAGGCTLEAAEAVCADKEIAHDEIFDVLAKLVDKSLLVVDWQKADVRYRMLETIRQFGREKLLESGEDAEIGNMHLDFFLALAGRAEPHLRGPLQAMWLERLEAEHDNVRAALEWSATGETAEAGLRLAGAFWWFWSVRSHYREGRRWLESALARSAWAISASRAKALAGAGRLALAQGDYAAAHVLLEEHLALCRQLGDREGIALSLNWLGVIAWRQGDLEGAEALYREALALSRDIGAKDRIGELLNYLGVLAAHRRDFATARAFYEQSLAIWREVGNKQGISLAVGNLGVAALRQGDYVAALTLSEESLAIDLELGNRRGGACEVEVFGLIAAARGQSARAARILGAAEALREAIGTPLAPSERVVYDYDRHMALVREALGSETFAALWAEGRSMTLEQSIEYALHKDAEPIGGQNGQVQ